MNDIKPILICWNPCDKEKLNSFLCEFLAIQNQLPLFDYVFNKEELNEKLANCEATYQSIIVLCELTWDNTRYSDFKGLELVQKDIRIKKGERKAINLPVLFVSFANQSMIINNDNTKVIINTYGLGHHFIQLPIAKKQELEDFGNMKPLTELEMIDVLHFCSFDRMIADIRHSIKNQNCIEDAKKSIISILKKTENILNFNELISEMNDCNDEIKLRSFCDKIQNQIIQGEYNKTSDNEFSNKIKYQVILVEDEDNKYIECLIDEAQKKEVFIKKCKNTKEAKDIIQNDIENNYSVVITDYRIWEDPTDQYNSRLLSPQGYTFIEESIKLGRLYKYISFTSMSRAFRIAAAERLPMKIESVDKDLMTITPEGRRVFIEKIIELAEINWIEINKKGSNKPVFIRFYNFYKSTKSNLRTEKDITETSIEYISKFDNVFLENQSVLFDYNPTINSFISYIGTIDEFKQSFDEELSENEQTIRRLSEIINQIAKIKTLDKQNEFLRKYLNNRISQQYIDNFIEKVLQINFVRSEDYSIEIGKQIFNALSKDEKDAIKKFGINRIVRNPENPNDLNQFINKLQARRLAIYIYYWLSNKYTNSKDILSKYAIGFGLGNCVNALLQDGYIKEDGYISSKPSGICSIILWLSAKDNKSRITSLKDIMLTLEEEVFFQINFPDLYSKWK